MSSKLSLLVTGPEALLNDFHILAAFFLDKTDRVQQTVRYTCFECELPVALEAAGKANVTLQKKIGNGEYELLHEGNHKMRWQPKEKK